VGRRPVEGGTDQTSQHWSELEAVAAASRRHDQPRSLRIAVDQEVGVERVGVQAQPGADQGSVRERRQRLSEELPELRLGAWIHDPGLVREHRATAAMVRDLERPVVLGGEPIPTRVGRVRGPRREPGRLPGTGIVDVEVQHGLTDRHHHVSQLDLPVPAGDV
jgi:hypothetical protein